YTTLFRSRRSRRPPARRGPAGGGRGAAAAGGAPQAALRGDPLASGDGAPARRRHERHGPRVHRGPAAGSLRPARRARTTGTQRKEHPMKRWIIGTPALALAAALVAGLPRVGLTKPHAPLWSERPATSGASAPAASPWVELARALKPAVVNISTKRVEEGWRPPESPFGQNDPFNQFFAPFFRGAPRRTVRSLGSGFAINSAGFVVTNNHVVDGATEIRVTLADGREFSAKVLGRDPKTDIALLKVEATGLPVIPLGDSARLEVGEPVMAIGNPFGLGFAIPINLAKPVLTQLAASGHVVRGYLGVTIQRVTTDLAKSFHLPDAHGALVTSVAEGGPARGAGLRPGDVIVEYDGRRLA